MDASSESYFILFLGVKVHHSLRMFFFCLALQQVFLTFHGMQSRFLVPMIQPLAYQAVGTILLKSWHWLLAWAGDGYNPKRVLVYKFKWQTKCWDLVVVGQQLIAIAKKNVRVCKRKHLGCWWKNRQETMEKGH